MYIHYKVSIVTSYIYINIEDFQYFIFQIYLKKNPLQQFLFIYLTLLLRISYGYNKYNSYMYK
jgi:hypothetical protein